MRKKMKDADSRKKIAKELAMSGEILCAKVCCDDWGIDFSEIEKELDNAD